MELSLHILKNLVRMLSMTFGSFAEIALSDTNQYLYVENAILPGKVKGATIGDDEKHFFI